MVLPSCDTRRCRFVGQGRVCAQEPMINGKATQGTTLLPSLPAPAVQTSPRNPKMCNIHKTLQTSQVKSGQPVKTEDKVCKVGAGFQEGRSLPGTRLLGPVPRAAPRLCGTSTRCLCWLVIVFQKLYVFKVNSLTQNCHLTRSASVFAG